MKLIRFALILAVICIVASGVLALTYKVTKPYIESQSIKKEKNSLKAIIPDADNFELKKVDSTEYYEAFLNKKLIGYIIPMEAQGYSSLIRFFTGIDLKGNILGVVILEQGETPGLGAKITEIKYGEKKPWFTEQLKGRPAKSLSLSEKGINAITGATISSRAVIEGISKKVNEFLGKIK